MGFTTLDTPLKSLLERIASSQLCLADFQRDYCWKPSQVKKLLHSVCMGYPIGSMLVVEASDNAPLGARGFTGQAYDESKCKELVLDGQQRLTSLFLALSKSAGVQHAYFVDLRKFHGVLDKRESWHQVLSDAIYDVQFSGAGKKHEISSHLDDKKSSDHRADLWLINNHRFPLSMLLKIHDEKDRLVEIAETEVDRLKAAGEPHAALAEHLLQYKSEWKEFKDIVKEANNVTETKLPCTTLDKACSLDAVARIFETINSTGTRLSMFDLMVAKCIRHKFQLRKEWDRLLNENEEIEAFEIEPEEFIETLYLLTPDSHQGFATDRILQMDIQHIRDNWAHLSGAMSIMVKDLRRMGIRDRKMLPYGPMLIPLAATYVKAYYLPRTKLRPVDYALFNEKIRWWFWSCVFGELYTEGASSRRLSHAIGLEQLCMGGKKLKEVESLGEIATVVSKVKSLDLTQVVPGSAVYKGLVSLLNQARLTDMYDGKEIGDGDKVEDHHLFPKDFLKKGPLANLEEDVRKTISNCICNRSLIGEKTNRSIGNKDPRQYIQDAFRATSGKNPTSQRLSEAEREVRNRFSSHLWVISGKIEEAFNLTIDSQTKFFTPLTLEDYKLFLKSRGDALMSLIVGGTGIGLPAELAD